MREIIFANGHTVNVQRAEPGLTGRFFRTLFLKPENGEAGEFLVTLDGRGIARDFRKAQAAVHNREELILQVGGGITTELPVIAFRRDSRNSLTFIVYCHPSALGVIMTS